MKNKLHIIKIAAVFVTAFFTMFSVSCTKEAEAESEKFTVVATVGMLSDVVASIGGDVIEVEALMSAGIDPHLYAPTTADTKKLLAADAVFYVGLYLEGKMQSSLESLAKKGKTVIAVGDILPKDVLLADEEYEGNPDPHVWMDVTLWKQVAAHVHKELVRLQPEHKETFDANAEAYFAKLDKLQIYAQETLSSIPEEKRVMITAHDAFGYLGRAYNLEVKGIQGISTGSEAGLREVNALVDEIVSRGIAAVFVETTVSDKNVKALIEGSEKQGHTLTIGGELFSDAMGAAGTYRGTYIGMIDHNVTVLARALGGDAPETGFQGELGTDHE